MTNKARIDGGPFVSIIDTLEIGVTHGEDKCINVVLTGKAGYSGYNCPFYTEFNRVVYPVGDFHFEYAAPI